MRCPASRLDTLYAVICLSPAFCHCSSTVPAVYAVIPSVTCNGSRDGVRYSIKIGVTSHGKSHIVLNTGAVIFMIFCIPFRLNHVPRLTQIRNALVERASSCRFRLSDPSASAHTHTPKKKKAGRYARMQENVFCWRTSDDKWGDKSACGNGKQVTKWQKGYHMPAR